MESKYYTPEIEEFHVGFEYEYFDGTDDNEKLLFEINGKIPLEIIKNWIQNNKVRVKYLDKKDIERLGFIQITDDCFNFPIKEFRGRLNQEVRILVRDTILIYLAMEIGDKDNIVLFTGTIKNKSELKKLMQQLNIK